MDYIGEQMLPGQIGHLCVIISFVASMLAGVSYYLSFRTEGSAEQENWRKLGRIFFLIDAAAVFAVFILLYFLIANHRYEYQYVYKNSANDLESKYILSAVWSASEGSFILWLLWHSILGIILMFTARKWEGPTMMVLSFAQCCLSALLIGVYVFGKKIGSSPFVLFREAMPDLPVFQNADYALRITDGNGLNMLLQNYWMVIHPPVLFLGFSGTIVPFSFAVGGIMKKDLGGWVKPALPWALFTAAVLGTGIMMGGAWAYESLSFGGYWAWDPVENASLVPWLVLVAGIHAMLIYKHTGRALKTSILFIALAFILIIYSTFLTRSGILGETSVHSFADLGMNAQLYIFLYIFFWLPAIITARNPVMKTWAVLAAFILLLLANYLHPAFAVLSPLIAIGWLIANLYRLIPGGEKEEAVSSREFWMFIGSLVLLLSALLIILQTSVPVYNEVFSKSVAPPHDVEFSYNRIQVFIAIILGILTGFGQYLKYKSTGRNIFLRKITIPLLIAAALSALILATGGIHYDKYGLGFLTAIWVAVASSLFAIVANLAYIWLGVKGSLKLSGPSIAHFGFGLMLLGILISSSKKEVLSYNTSGIFVNFGTESNEKSGENLTLVKGMKMDMGKYHVTYESDSIHPEKSQWYYKLRFESKDGKENFVLKPNAFINYKGNEGLMANPDARHYWDHDIFAYITALPDPEKNKDTSSFETRIIKRGDSLFYSKGYIILDDVRTLDSLPEELFGKDGKLYEAVFKIHSNNNSIYTSVPRLAYAKGSFLNVPDTVMSESLILQLQHYDGETAEVGLKESDSVMQYVTLKAYKFPFINLLWLGTILMALGFIISMVRRIRVS